ncbi:MAG TPA: hypothetical protein PLQ19_02885 [Aeromicrobium sp.]|nr:hypothetical protein [Aeromicrobium sp.]
MSTDASTARVRLTALLAGLLLLTACSETPPNDGTEASSQSSTTPVSQTDGEVAHVVTMIGDRIRIYADPTLEQFVEEEMIANVLVGQVTKTEAVVSQPGNHVETILTVQVAAQRNGGPTTVYVRERGGVVPLSKVRSDFEGKLGRVLADGELEKLVDYRVEDVEHAAQGDEVLLIVATDDSADRPGSYVSMGRLVRRAGDRGIDPVEATYEWAGMSPNEAWVKSVVAKDLL